MFRTTASEFRLDDSCT